MAKRVAIGIQSFEKLREGNYFYVDKTDFIREWWDSGDDVICKKWICKEVYGYSKLAGWI